jgi:hypothetical protein
LGKGTEMRHFVFVYLYCHWRSSYQEGKFGIPLIGLTLPHFCAFPQAMTWIFNVIRRDPFVFSNGNINKRKQNVQIRFTQDDHILSKTE